MLQNAYFLAKICADTAKNEQHFAEILPKTGNYPTRWRLGGLVGGLVGGPRVALGDVPPESLGLRVPPPRDLRAACKSQIRIGVLPESAKYTNTWVNFYQNVANSWPVFRKQILVRKK